MIPSPPPRPFSPRGARATGPVSSTAMIDVPDLPRTNHDLAQDFGAVRHLERRATGRKMASPAMVVRAAVRMVALMATRDQPLSADDLRPRDLAVWKALRQRIAVRHELRRRPPPLNG